MSGTAAGVAWRGAPGCAGGVQSGLGIRCPSGEGMQPSSALLAPGFCPCCCSGSFLSQKIDEKKRLQESISAHKTGLPDRILRLFAPRPPLPHSEGKRKRPPPVPLSGIAQYVDRFAKPGDPEYEPPPPETRPPEPRIFRNPELGTQARVDIETKLEKWVLHYSRNAWGQLGGGWCSGVVCWLQAAVRAAG